MVVEGDEKFLGTRAGGQPKARERGRRSHEFHKVTARDIIRLELAGPLREAIEAAHFVCQILTNIVVSYDDGERQLSPHQEILSQMILTFAEVAHLIEQVAHVAVLLEPLGQLRLALLRAMTTYAERYGVSSPMKLLPAASLATLVSWAATQPTFCSPLQASPQVGVALVVVVNVHVSLLIMPPPSCFETVDGCS
jgi:hypothetical protein